MPQIPQISGPVNAGKGLSTAANGHNPNAEPFEMNGVGDTPRIADVAQNMGGASVRTATGGDAPAVSVPAAKDPSMAVETLRDVINNELLANAKINGYAELAGDLDALSKTLYLNPNSLLGEIMTQEKDNTAFSGSSFYDILRNLTQNGGENTKELVANMLKAINNAGSRDDILKAITSNVKFLSQYYGKNTTLAKSFTELYDAWNSDGVKNNFEALRDKTTALIRTASESLQNDELTSTLLPLLTHNLSRFNTNSYTLKEAFTALMTQVPSDSDRETLTNTFAQVLTKLFGKDTATDINYTTFAKINQDPAQDFVQNNERINVSDFLGEKLKDSAYTASIPLDTDAAESAVRGFLLGKTDGMTALKTVLAQLFPAPDTATDEFSALSSAGNLASAPLPDGKKAESVLQRADAQKALETMNAEISSKTNLKELVSYLNDILAKMPEMPQRQQLCDTLGEIVQQMAKNHELPTDHQPAPVERGESDTMEALTAFIDKNINHPAVKSVDNFNASNMLQSMLNAPGVFTPLSHYIVPLQVEDTRAFGELWVDNDAEKDGGKAVSGEKKYHLFLTFDVDSLGRFEVNAYSSGSNLNVSVMYPAGYTERASELTKKITRVAAGLGFNTQDFKTGVLEKAHTLTEVFPHISENRRSFNVKA